MKLSDGNEYSRLMERVVVAFTTYNPSEELSEHVRVAADECKQVLLIDDGSTRGFDGYRDERDFPAHLTAIWKPSNAGIADSVNIALEYALQVGAEYLIFFDQDTVVFPGLVPSAVQSAARLVAISPQPVGCVGAGVVHGRRNVGRGPRSGISDVPEVIQSGTVFVVEALRAIGGANAELIIDAVDTDVCLRLRKSGYRVATDEAIAIRHPVGSGRSFNVLGHSVLVTNHSPMRRYYMTRNRIHILRQLQWWRFDLRWCAIYLRRFIVSCAIAVLIEERRLAKLRAIALGIDDGFRGRLGPRGGWR